jgi:hypothetical protein
MENLVTNPQTQPSDFQVSQNATSGQLPEATSTCRAYFAKVDYFRSSESVAGNGFRTPRQFIEAVFYRCLIILEASI